MKWITIAEYCKLKNIKNPQTVYNMIYMNKLKEGVDWKDVDVTLKKKMMRYE